MPRLLRRRGAVALLRRPGFRRVYLAVATSTLGDAFQYIALMWAALLAGGPLGVLVVRLADSVPALVFGFHGGVLADRGERRRLMVGADLVRAAVLVPVAIAGLAGDLPLWALVVAAFVLTTSASYFDPAYGAVLPALAGRDGVQAANALVRASADAVWLGGSAFAAALLTVVPLSTFFAINAGSFVLSALLLAGLPSFTAVPADASPPRVWGRSPSCVRIPGWRRRWARSGWPSRSRPERGSSVCRSSRAAGSTAARVGSRS